MGVLEVLVIGNVFARLMVIKLIPLTHPDVYKVSITIKLFIGSFALPKRFCQAELNIRL